MNLLRHYHLLTLFPTCQSFLSISILDQTMNKSAASSTLLGKRNEEEETICLGFVGDVMLGRGVDAILPNHVDGKIHESYMKHATGYVTLAVRQNGPLPKNEVKERGSNYIWGDLIKTFQNVPDIMISNLETALTTSNDFAKWKGINYRAHPLNVQSLKAFGSGSIVTLANNHVLDWGVDGLKETIATLDQANIPHAGAGLSIYGAKAPASSMVKNRKVSVIAVGLPSAGVPEQWMAGETKCGVNFVDDATPSNARKIMKSFQEAHCESSIKVVSLHMGPNWNDKIPNTWRIFAHTFIDNGADIVVAHSSHHVKGLEVYKNKMISYGLGDFLNDYEGITGQGYEAHRQDLTCLYLPRIRSNGEVEEIEIIPCQIKHLKVQRATNPDDIKWICSTLSKEGRKLGTLCEMVQDHKGRVNLRIKWTSQ